METQGLTFALESVFGSPAETWALSRAQWEETEESYRAGHLMPDVQEYKRLEQSGMCRYFTARFDGAMVGHILFIVHSQRFTRESNASEDFFFLDKGHRKGTNAIRLLRFAVAQLQSEGVRQISMCSKLTAGRDIGVLLRRVGFRHVADLYVL